MALVAFILIVILIVGILNKENYRNTVKKSHSSHMRNIPRRTALDTSHIAKYIPKRMSDKEVKFYASYKEYLISDEWKKLKKQRLEIDSNICQQCKIPITLETSNCHHIHYRNLYNENIEEDLISLCHSCHQIIHDHYGKDAKNYPILKNYAHNMLTNWSATEYIVFNEKKNKKWFLPQYDFKLIGFSNY